MKGITKKKYLEIRKKYGKCSSWAIWKNVKARDRAKDHVGDLSVFDLKKNPNILKKLKPNMILVALNISRKFNHYFANFHDGGKDSQDYKLRYATKGNKYEGAYVTDIIKGVKQKKSTKLMKCLKRHPDLIKKNIRSFEYELKVVGSKNPIIIALGGNTCWILNKDERFKNKLMRVTHYSHRISKKNLKKEFENLKVRK